MTLELNTRILPAPVLVVLLILATAAVWALYRRDRILLSRGTGRLLFALRWLLVMACCVLLSGPVLVSRRLVIDRGEVLLVVDCSRSFSLTDLHRPAWQAEEEARALGEHEAPNARALRQATRRKLVQRALETSWLQELAGRFRVSVFSLADELRFVETLDGSPGGRFRPPDLPAADGSTTDLGAPLVAELRRRAGDPLAGVIIFTDGHHHGAGRPADALGVLPVLDVPLFVVGVGALEWPPDLALESVDAPGDLFAGDDVNAELTIAAAGLPDSDVRLRISEGSTLIHEATFPVTGAPGDGIGRAFTRIPVSFPAGKPGRRKYTFTVVPLTGEVSESNNSRDLRVEVRSEKARVLYLDRGPRWDAQYLREAWRRDEAVELEDFITTSPPDPRLPSAFPRRRDLLFDHDVLVLGDVTPDVFVQEEIELLRDFVRQRGGALILLCGDLFLPYAWTDTPLREVLPVRLLEPSPSRGAGVVRTSQGLPLTLSPAGQVAGLTRLVAGRETNLRLWELLPPPMWISPLAGTVPGAEILVHVQTTAASRLPWAEPIPGGGASADRGDSNPDEAILQILAQRGAVVVTREVGAGQVLYVGTDATWKWRFRFGEELFERFWGQAVRWAVTSRLETADEHVRLGTDRFVYGPDERVEVEALVEWEAGRPAEDALVDAVITRMSDSRRERLRLTPVPRSGGRYRGVARLEELFKDVTPEKGSGEEPSVEYRLQLDIPDIPDYSSRTPRAEVVFVVEALPDLELRDITCDVETLESMASAAEGTYLPFWRFRESTQGMKEASREREEVEETEPWSLSWLVAAILFGLLATEWVLRKWRELV